MSEENPTPPTSPPKTRDFAVVVVVALIAVTLGANLFLLLDDGDDAKRTGESVPSFEMEVVGSDEVDDPAAHRGKVVVLDFWATWCTACKQQMPTLEALAADPAYRDAVVFLSVNVDDDEDGRLEKVERFVADRSLGGKVLIGTASIQRWFQIKVLPTVVVLTPDGVVHQVLQGVRDEAEFRETIADAQ